MKQVLYKYKLSLNFLLQKTGAKSVPFIFLLSAKPLFNHIVPFRIRSVTDTSTVEKKQTKRTRDKTR